MDSARLRRPTQSDVAQLAGVSRGVVSAVINGPNAKGTIGVGPQTRERVWEAIRALGYVPNVAARQLARGRNNLVGVFTHEPVFPMESANFYYEFLVGIEQEADALGYNLVMFTSARDSTGQRTIYDDGQNALQLADGAIILGGHRRREELARLAEDEFPFVIVGRREIQDTDVSYVAADYRSGAAEVVTELTRLGHQRMVLVGRHRDTESSDDRRAGFAEGLRRHGLDAIDHASIDVEKIDLERLRELGISAIVAETQWEAATLRERAQAQQWPVPQSLSIVSLGGLSSQPTPPDLGRLVIPRRDMGREAVRALTERIAHPDSPPIHRLVPCTLDLRHTTGPAPH